MAVLGTCVPWAEGRSPALILEGHTRQVWAQGEGQEVRTGLPRSRGVSRRGAGGGGAPEAVSRGGRVSLSAFRGHPKQGAEQTARGTAEAWDRPGGGTRGGRRGGLSGRIIRNYWAHGQPPQGGTGGSCALAM